MKFVQKLKNTGYNMLCCVITGPSYVDVLTQINEASKDADILELRWDCFDSLDFKIHSQLPMIFTLRPLSQGGKYAKNEESRLESLEQLLELRPDYVDLEYTIPLRIIKKLQKKFPSVKTILSFHDFNKTAIDLNELLKDLEKKPADFYKIATFANSTIDALRMVNFSKQKGPKVIGLCMGELGAISRILNHFTYCSLKNNSLSLGLLSLESLIDCYRYKSINAKTKIYGLIGNPVDKSFSDITHNKVFDFYDLDAVYIKMNVKIDELRCFFKEIKTLNFMGLSVTMPLKEAVLPYLNKIDSKAFAISAVNTIVCENQNLTGFNTDCTGAIDAIEEKIAVKNKHILIIGAGGSARAIAYEAVLRQANVTILNRNLKKALKIAEELCCKGGSINDIKTYYVNGYDILINCTPNELPFDPLFILDHVVVMDIQSFPKWTKLLLEAKNKNCDIIFGFEMFVNQAIGQFQHWFKEDIDFKNIKAIMYN